MILYRKEPYPLQMKNIMLLDDAKSGGVVYVNKATYDQALMLYSRFDGNVKRVTDTIKSKKTEIYITVPNLPNVIETMGKTMPEPLNVLAPFLMLCANNEGLEWNVDDREMVYGILHQYSQLIDFNAMTLVPAEVRANIQFPTSLLKQYKVSWDDLCSTLEDKVMLASKTVVQEVRVEQPVQVAAPAPVQQTPAVAPNPTPAQPAPVQQAPTTHPAPAKEAEKPLSPLEKKLMEIKKQAEERDKAINKKAAETPKPTPAAKPATITTAAKKEAETNSQLLNEYDF